MSARWNITPRRSHVFLTALLLSGLVCVLTGAAFLWYGKLLGFVPILVGLPLKYFAILGWWRSQADVDLEGAAPTIVKQSKDGFEVRTDSRMLSAGKERAALISNLLDIAAYREELPAPDGLVAKSGDPMPEGIDEARRRVEAVNELVQKAGAAVFEATRSDTTAQILVPELPVEHLKPEQART